MEINKIIGFISLNKDINACKNAFKNYFNDNKPNTATNMIHNVEKFVDPLTHTSTHLLYGGEEGRLRGFKLDILVINVEFGTLTDLEAFNRIDNAIKHLKIANPNMEVRIYYNTNKE
ncbi:MAG: hypothetical protein NC548_15870 [Lachnospiraceae bacterium]|nr:hypothetical protein [Lachnospiraceae bacterium]